MRDECNSLLPELVQGLIRRHPPDDNPISRQLPKNKQAATNPLRADPPHRDEERSVRRDTGHVEVRHKDTIHVARAQDLSLDLACGHALPRHMDDELVIVMLVIESELIHTRTAPGRGVEPV